MAVAPSGTGTGAILSIYGVSENSLQEQLVQEIESFVPLSEEHVAIERCDAFEESLKMAEIDWPSLPG